jgi:hypothetical protein
MGAKVRQRQIAAGYLWNRPEKNFQVKDLFKGKGDFLK